MIVGKEMGNVLKRIEKEVERMETKDWKEQPRQEREKAQNIRELIGKPFVINSFEEKVGNATDKEGKPKVYTYAIVKTDKGVFRTASAVLVKQLNQMKEDLQKGVGVRVKIVYRKNYLTFDSP
jgi:hypothetical protein